MCKYFAILFLLTSCNSAQTVGNSATRSKSTQSQDEKAVVEESGSYTEDLNRDYGDQNTSKNDSYSEEDEKVSQEQDVNDQKDNPEQDKELETKIIEKNEVTVEEEVDYSKYPTARIFQKTEQLTYYGKTTKKAPQLSNEYLSVSFYNEVELMADEANAYYFGLNIEKIIVKMYYHDRDDSKFSGQAFKVFMYDNIPGTVPLFRCYSKGEWDYFNSLDERCEGKNYTGIYLGHIFKDSEMGTPLIRCYSNTKKSHHTVSKEQGCPEQYTFEKYLGSYQQ